MTDHRFRLLLAALATSSLGDWVSNVALLAFVAERGGAGWLGVVTAARVLPIVVLGPFGGVLADRRDRRRLMLAADVVRGVLMGLLAFVALAGLPLWLAPLLAALATVAGSAHPACVSATTPRLVSDADLPRANAARAAIGQGAIVAGPALGALILVVASPAAAFAVNAASFAISAAATFAIPAGPAFAPVPGERADVLGDLRAAGRALRRAPEALHLVAADLACSAVYGAQTVLLVLVARRVTGGDGGYGLLLGAYGIGGLAGAAFAARTRAPSRRVLAFGLLAVAAPLPLLGLTSSLPVALGLALAGGGGGVMAEVLSETALQRALPEAVLGGAFGLVVPASLAGIVAGALVAAPLAAAFGLAGALTAIAAAVLLLLGALTVSRPAAPAAVAV